MSVDASFARSTGPFVQIVASATWFVSDRRVVLDGELQLDPGRVRELTLELAELLLRIGPDRVADLDVLAFDLQAHLGSPFERRSLTRNLVDLSAAPARANVTTSTETAPAARRAVAAADTVEPVVYTSSTRTTRPRTGCRPEGAADVSPPLLAREAALAVAAGACGRAPARREPPAAAELAGEARGRVVAAREAPLAVGRHERDQLSGRPWHDLDHERGSDQGEAAQPALLPGGDERADARVVCDRGPGGGERDPPARALAAARDRPGDGRTAAGA